jgi:hypothetical protein
LEVIAMKELRVPGLTLIAVVLAATAADARPPRGCRDCDSLSEVTTKFIEQLNDGRFRAAVERFDSKLEKKLAAEELERTWKDLTPRLGRFQKITAVRTTEKSGTVVFVVTCAFDKGEIEVELVYDSSQKIAEMSIDPSGSKDRAEE